MCGNRGVKVFDSTTTPFESRLDCAEVLADGIGPGGPCELRANQLESFAQMVSTL